MKVQWLPIISAILCAVAALLLCLTCRAGDDIHRVAVAASLDTTPAAFPLAASPLVPPGKTASLDADSTDNTASRGWLTECVDCPKYFTNMTDRSLRLDAAGHPRNAYGADYLYYAWHDGGKLAL
jgi:hypothetical protein